MLEKGKKIVISENSNCWRKNSFAEKYFLLFKNKLIQQSVANKKYLIIFNKLNMRLRNSCDYSALFFWFRHIRNISRNSRVHFNRLIATRRVIAIHAVRLMHNWSHYSYTRSTAFSNDRRTVWHNRSRSWRAWFFYNENYARMQKIKKSRN